MTEITNHFPLLPEYIYFSDYETAIQQLSLKALPEEWNLESALIKDIREENNFILKFYLDRMYGYALQLSQIKQIKFAGSYAIFHTGLYTSSYKPIYMLSQLVFQYSEEASAPDYNNQQWKFVGFLDKDEIIDFVKNNINYSIVDEIWNKEDDYEFQEYCNKTNTPVPARPNFYFNPFRLIYKPTNEIAVNYEKIMKSIMGIRDNLVKEFEGNKASDKYNVHTSIARELAKYFNSIIVEVLDNKNDKLLKEAVTLSLNKLKANCSLAVPIYYDYEIRLAVPLFLSPNYKDLHPLDFNITPDLALVLTWNSPKKCYVADRCLTLDMAYCYVRVISRQEENWLEMSEVV